MAGVGVAPPLLLLLLAVVGLPAAGGLGVNWGTMASHQLPASTVVRMLQDNGIKKVKLFDADAEPLGALAGSGVEVMVAIPNNMLDMMTDYDTAREWVHKNVSAYNFGGGVNIRSRASHIPWQAAVVAAMYSDSHEDRATTLCFCDCQLIRLLPRKKATPVVLLRWTLVTRKKKQKSKVPSRSSEAGVLTPAVDPMKQFRAARVRRLNSLIGPIGPADGLCGKIKTIDSDVPVLVGLTAQTNPVSGLSSLRSEAQPAGSVRSEQILQETPIAAIVVPSIAATPRVRRLPKPGFPAPRPGRAARIRRPAMAGRGAGGPPAKQQAAPQPSAPVVAPRAAQGRETGGSLGRGMHQQRQGDFRDAPQNRFPEGWNGRQSGRQNSYEGGFRDPARGRWGDDGFDAYGPGQHRGSSSSGGGGGYAWPGDDYVDREFQGPPGSFVEGAYAPSQRPRGGYRARGGRGGGRRPPPPRLPAQLKSSTGARDNTSLVPPSTVM